MKVSNPPIEGVVGKMGFIRKIGLKELLDMAHPSIQPQLGNMMDGAGIAVFEVLDMCSSQFGRRSFLKYGPGCTYKSLDELKDGHLGDVPSRFAWPVAYYDLEEKS